MEKIQNMQSNISEFIYWLFVIAQMASVFFNNKYENNNPLTSLWWELCEAEFIKFLGL